jgi:poly-beta-1,6-N-acetyl-D-glucosamine synthase
MSFGWPRLIVRHETALGAASEGTQVNHPPRRFAFAVPCHNEHANIGRLVAALSKVTFRGSGPERIVVVSDASSDGTDEIVMEAARQSTVSVRLIQRGERLGKCSAINRALLEMENVEVVVMVSADTLPGEGCIARLLTAFDDPTVGVAGGRPVPTGDSWLWSVRVTRVLWVVHHFIASVQPKTTEITAFRNVEIRLDENSLVDEAEIEHTIGAKGFTVAYIPDAIVYTPSALTIADYVRQRTRVTVGHIQLRRRSSFTIGSLSIGLRVRATMRALREESCDVPAVSLGVLLEVVIYIAGWARAYRTHSKSGIWERIESTKRTVERPPDVPELKE